MESIVFNATERKELKKSATRRLRKQGKIPGIVYGFMGSLPVAVDSHDFHSKFHTISENNIITLKIGDRSYDVLVKDYQSNILKGTIEHLDFYAIQSDKTVRTRIPIHFIGSSKGVREGGILEVQLHELEVECLPRDIQSEVPVDITHLDIGHALHVKDIQLPPGIKVLVPADQVVASVVHARAEAAAAAPAEAEVAEGTTEGSTAEPGKAADAKAASEKK
ncbi:MAG TPA: 50S ribosomal protein L25 [Spirochaetales bacterium]|nr:50S ribosomal protein L25 [Spirochaetales bacterium]